MKCEMDDTEFEVDDAVAVGPDYVVCPGCGFIIEIETCEVYFKQATPRASSLPKMEGKSNPEWWITEDGKPFCVGQKVYNYYDGLWVTVISPPDDYDGWFTVENEAGGRNTLNSVRIASKEPRR